MQGTLTLTLVDARLRHYKWRGSSRDEGYPAKIAETLENRIRATVGMLLDQIPAAGETGS